MIFGYLFIKKKVEALRRPAEASQRSGKKFSAGVDHAGLKAERRNSGLALLVVIAIAILVINLIPHPNSPQVIATLQSGLGNDGRRKR
ncbi:hypothetical protein [Pedobacter sp. CFBP9032]|uniref:hypothetical protein n=1 Tax=Pedobacter sp. CFBP9032 TaxID=3096539 RepID=UPI002A69ACFB|nr:hypothetical protein [Pedobacter sp. CFBP9032]MDY0905677.1 hypothetical protein [Pedobacter sp. CFBP9032]